jgi:hypothetical protein
MPPAPATAADVPESGGEPSREAFVRPITWGLVVFFPDHEKKDFVLTESDAEIPLHSSLWKCTAGRDADVREGSLTLESGTVRCEDGHGQVSTSALCARSSVPTSHEANLAIGGDGHGFSIVMECSNRSKH